MNQITLTALPKIPMIQKGDDLVQIILKGLNRAKIEMKNGDVFVIAQKIVSKSEGRLIDLNDVTPSKKAKEIGKKMNKDPRLIELILSESKEVIRFTQEHLIVRHRLGFVIANAGLDQSNVNTDPLSNTKALLLPYNPDASCRKMREQILKRTEKKVGIIINDSHGRPFKKGVTGSAIGVAGIPVLRDMRGTHDLFQRKLATTLIASADELAAAGSILMGQADEGKPIIHVRGFPFKAKQVTIKEIFYNKKEELFL